MKESEAGIQTPRSVSMAVTAIWIVIAIRAVVTGTNVVESAPRQANPVAFGMALTVLLVVGLGLLAWINMKIKARHAWAAIVFFIITAFVMLGATQSLYLLFSQSSFHGTLRVVAIAMNLAAAVLLLRRESRVWLFTGNDTASASIFLGVVSILLSTLCLVIMPAFTAAIIVAALVGISTGAYAMTQGARRTAGVTLMFAVVPLCGFLAMENLTKYVGTGYVAFAPLFIAAAVSVWMMVNYSLAKRATPRSTM